MEESNRDIRTPVYQRVASFDSFGFAIFESEVEKEVQEAEPRSHEDRQPSLSRKEIQEWEKLLEDWNSPLGVAATAKVSQLVRRGVPRELRPRLWKKFLESDTLRGASSFSYKANLVAVREQFVDLGITEYGTESLHLLYQITEAEEEENHQHGHIDPACIRQIMLDLERTYPTHRMFMGKTAEATEGRAALFRVLAIYARYNPDVGYCQGMSYIAGMFLMHMEEEDAFWCMVALLQRQKYLLGYFDSSLARIQRHAKVFHRLMKQRFPNLSEHMDSLGLLPLMFITSWYMSLFTGLACWDTVLAIWDKLLLDGVSTIFGVGLAILQLYEDELLAKKDIAQMAPSLLHLPIHIVEYRSLVCALWGVRVDGWEVAGLQACVVEEEENENLSDSNKKRRHRSQRNNQQLSTSKKKRTKSNSGPVKPAQNENSMLKRIFSMFGSTSQKQALRPHNPPAKVACLSLRKPSKGAGKRSGSPRTPRPGLARRARADSLVLKVSPCDEATEKHSLPNKDALTVRRKVSNESPVRRSPRLVVKRGRGTPAKVHQAVSWRPRSVNTPANKRLVSKKASIQYTFKQFHTPTTLRRSQRSRSNFSPSNLSSPEIELMFVGNQSVKPTKSQTPPSVTSLRRRGRNSLSPSPRRMMMDCDREMKTIEKLTTTHISTPPYLLRRGRSSLSPGSLESPDVGRHLLDKGRLVFMDTM